MDDAAVADAFKTSPDGQFVAVAASEVATSEDAATSARVYRIADGTMVAYRKFRTDIF